MANIQKKLGCEWLNGGLYLAPNAIYHCCSGNENMVTDEWLAPVATHINKDSVLDKGFFEKIVESKLKYIEQINSGIVCECTGCSYLRRDDWGDIGIKIISVASDWTCNSNCYYCFQHDHSQKPDYNTLDVLNGLISNNLIKDNDLSAIFWTGGEFTIQKHFSDSFELLDKYTLSSNFTSSGIVYSEVVTKRLNNLRHSNIVISIDSGSRETYKKIKRVDQFDKVLNNIKLYYENVSNKSRIGIKYIILPENCSKTEIDNFFNILVDNNLTKCSIIVDIDFLAPKELNSDLLSGLYYFSMKLLQLQDRYPYFGYSLFHRFPWLEEVINYHNSEFTRRSFEMLPLSNYSFVRSILDIIIPFVFGKGGKKETLKKISLIVEAMKRIKKILKKSINNSN